MPSKREQVLELLRQKTLVRPKDVVAAGLPKDYLYQLVQEGLNNNVGRGLYQLPDPGISEWNGYVEAERRVPKAFVACCWPWCFITKPLRTEWH